MHQCITLVLCISMFLSQKISVILVETLHFIISDKLKKWKESLLISHACFWSSRKNVTEAKEKKCLFPSERPGEIFFPTMQSVIFFWNNKWIKKNIKHKKKTEKKKEKWDQSKKKSLRYTCFNWCKCKCFS